MTNSLLKSRYSGRIFLLIAIIIFGVANSVTRKLTEIGTENLIDGRNPISFCNVLFVGNLCALILLSIIYYNQWQVKLLKQISGQKWLNLTVVAILGTVVSPMLVFMALSITTVNNVILIGQIDTPLILGLSLWLFKEKVNTWVITGAIVSLIGVSLTVILQPAESVHKIETMGMDVGKGELMVLIAAICRAISNIISKGSLGDIPLGIFSTFRMFMGTIVFFTIATILYGPEHFMDVTSPFLWKWMLFYSAVIVVGGQLLWFSGLRQSTASEVSLVTAFSPLAGVLSAYLILGEAPTTAQYIGGFVILCGIALNQRGVSLLNANINANIPTQKPNDKEMSEAVGFKGI